MRSNSFGALDQTPNWNSREAEQKKKNWVYTSILPVFLPRIYRLKKRDEVYEIFSWIELNVSGGDGGGGGFI